MRKILVVFLALALCLTTGGLVAYAAGNDSGPVTEVELHPGEAAAVASFEFNSTTEDGVYTYVTDTVEESGIDTRAVSISEDFTVAVGNSWSRSFDTGKLFVENHNAFKTIISDVSGTYKLLITDDQGYEYSSGEYSTGKTFNTTNASADRTFTVYILNTGTSKLTGHVKISSYYNE